MKRKRNQKSPPSDDFTNSRVAEIGKELQLLESNRGVEILQKRGNEDIFLRDVEPLRAEAARVRGLNIDMSHLKLVALIRHFTLVHHQAEPYAFVGSGRFQRGECTDGQPPR